MVVGVVSVSARSINEIESYGIYVQDAKGYVAVPAFQHDDSFVDFKYLNEVPVAKRESQQLKLIVYMKDFSPESIGLELRPLDVKVRLEKLSFHVKPMEKANMYEVSLDAPVKDGAMLQIHYWSFFDRMGVVMLGDTGEELVKYFSQKQMPNASVVNQYLSDALRAFPDNAKLMELGVYWHKAAEVEKDREAYAYVEEKWQKYEKAEKLTLKQRYLNEVMGEISGYLRDHPDGSNAKEARERKAMAEKKLKEYEKLL